jgi:hypothetical protein
VTRPVISLSCFSQLAADATAGTPLDASDWYSLSLDPSCHSIDVRHDRESILLPL